MPAQGANPDGDLRIEIFTGYNAVVDSNVESPSTYAPRSAYIGAKFCNDGSDDLTDVIACIGNYNGGVSPTPGIYPSRAHPPLVGPLAGNEFALTHEGGTMGVQDASRFLGTIKAGECKTVYWLISYPNLDVNGDAVWGPSIKPDDDLWLNYDIWATAADGMTSLEAAERRDLTMRNEISAMANKIYPNTAGKVPDEYMELLQKYAPEWTNGITETVLGRVMWTEGVWYDLGNIGAGFDNDGDLVPDHNAWLQPVGDPSLFDPSAFRLVHTYAMVIVKNLVGTNDVLFVDDQLYFEHVPENRGAVGLVRYDYIPLLANASSSLSPYQEVASGYDNEKFNGDYGATWGDPLNTSTSQVDLVKTANKAIADLGNTIQYTLAYTNTSHIDVGEPDLNMTLVVQETIPTGTTYVAGSATAANVLPDGVSSYRVLYSTDGRQTWTRQEPVPATTVTDIQWWLSDRLPGYEAGIVRFSVTIVDPYPLNTPIIINVGGLSFGNTYPFIQDDATTLVRGTNRLGDTVFADTGAGGGVLGDGLQNGTEPGIANVQVKFYYDRDGDGTVDPEDVYLGSTNTSSTGYYLFDRLPDGYYIVKVDLDDPDIPFGWAATTNTSYLVSLDPGRTTPNTISYLNADFAFAPVMELTKARVGSGNLREGNTVTYNLTVTNRLRGSGGVAVYTLWATNEVTSLKVGTGWQNIPYAYSPNYPNSQYSTLAFANNADAFGVSGHSIAAQKGNITKVELMLPISASGTFRPGDTMQFTFYTNYNNAATYTTNKLASLYTSGMYVLDVTSRRNWTWADFGPGNQMAIQAYGRKSGGGATGVFGVDQMGFRITTDWELVDSTPSVTLDPVPLYDVYRADMLQYISASLAPQSVTTNGTPPMATIEWSNIGPLAPGAGKTITVNFRVLQPPSNSVSTVTNTAIVTGATYADDRPVGSATSRVTTTVLPAGTIGDFVWRDLDGDGVQDGGTETGIAGVRVVCTPPAGVNLGNGPGRPITNITDSTGYYLFTSLPSNGNYTITVLTATLPGGTGTCTFDRDGTPNSTTVVPITYNSTTGLDTVLDADFGYRNINSRIDGTVWHDWNRSGTPTPDSGEEWMPGLTVYLFAGTTPGAPGTQLATTTTDANGYFQFTGNYVGNYCVQVVTNSGTLSQPMWVQSFDTDGTGTRNYVTLSMVSGGSGRADYSYFRNGLYAIGDTVFYDWDGDGVQDANEEGIPSISMSLYEDFDKDGVVDAGVDTLLRVTETTSSGYYVFPSLAPTNYIVIVDENDVDFPPRFICTADPYGANDGRSKLLLGTANRWDQDFGYQPYGNGAIGDTVWADLNGDGVQAGPLETGISNILVTLQVDMNGDGSYVSLATTSTDANGYYLFPDLPQGAYRVVVSTNDTDMRTDSFGVYYQPTTPILVSATISNSLVFLDADFGFAPMGAIGDTIFWDADRNGTQEGEDGIPGVTVNLYLDINGNKVYDAGVDTFHRSEVTDLNGNYLFTGLATGRYVVVVDKSGPIATADLTADPSADGLPCWDPAAVGCDNEYGVRLYPGTSFMGADFGYQADGVIGDTVWLDTDNDGIQDDTEVGIPYVTVLLYSNSVLVASNETDSSGQYLFMDLPDGTYEVRVKTTDVDFWPGLTQTYDRDGTLDNKASSIVISGGDVTSIGGVSCTDCSLTADFGYRFSGNNSLSGTVGLEGTPTNGVMGTGEHGYTSSNEAPYVGVTVYLTYWMDDGDNVIEDGETRIISSTQTSTNGDYSFSGLPSGDGNDKYIVSLAAPEDAIKLTTTTGVTPAFRVVESTDNQDYTDSAYQAVTIASVITNMDFAFRTLQLFDYGDLPVSYSTLLESSPSGAGHKLKTVPNLYLGSTVDGELNGKPTVDATGDGADEDGVSPVGVWQDGTNGGSLLFTIGQGEGWVVGFMDFANNGNFLDSTDMITYEFAATNGGNGSGVYSNIFTIPAGTISATTSTVLYARFRLFQNQPMIPQVAYSGKASNGEVEDYRWVLGAIGDRVWKDLDADGIQDAGEAGISNVTVYVDLNGDGVRQATEPSAVTDAAGDYGIGGFIAGTYTVRVDSSTVPPYLVASYDLDGTSTLHRTSVTLTSGQVRSDVDFGYAPMAIGGLAWLDQDRDGIRDETGSYGITNILVRLYDGNTNWIGSTTTGPDGMYRFDLDLPGNYMIEFFPVSYSISPRDQGGNDALDSDIATNAPYRTWMTYISPGERDLTWDAGLYPPVYSNSIGDYVWFDYDRDGTQDIGERGLGSVTVELYNASSVLVRQTLTDVQGYYYFAGLPPGNYSIRYLLPPAYHFTLQDATMDDTADSDANTNTGFTAQFTVGSTTTNYSYDAGLYALVDLKVTKTVNNPAPDPSNTVWFTVSVSNAGPAAATGVQLTDVWPSSKITFIAAVPSVGTYASSNHVWTLGSLAAHATASMVMTGMVQSGTVGQTITNVVRISRIFEPDTDPSNNAATSTVSVAGLDLAVSKTVNNANPYPGSNVTYTIVVTNYGPKVATGVVFSDLLPTGVSYVSHTVSVGAYVPGTGLWTIGTMAVNSGARMTITATVGPTYGGKPITNNVSLYAVNQTDTVASNNTSRAIITPVGAELALSKSVNPDQANEGEAVIYTIRVRNNGPNTATGVQVTERLTNGLVYVSNTTSQGSYNSVNGIWSVGTLNVSSSATLRITATIGGGMRFTFITNRSAITACDLQDPILSNNWAIAVVAVSDLKIRKTSNMQGTFVPPGSNITYTVVVTNVGVPPHTGVTIRDPVPSGVSYVAGTAQMRAPYTTNFWFYDQFGSQSYTLNAGNTNFVNGWTETNEATSATAGNVTVNAAGYVTLSGNSFGLFRRARTTAARTLTLSFKYQRRALDNSADYVAVYVSKTGNPPWTEVYRISGTANDGSFQTASVDISAYKGSNMGVLFLTSGMANNDYVDIDDVRIDMMERRYQTLTANAPPNMVTNVTLLENDSVTLTFQARVLNPPTSFAITNVVSMTSDLMPEPRYASVTDRVEYLDLGVVKDINDPNPGLNETITYTVNVTNYGPCNASQVVLREAWPSTQVTFSNATVTRGSYDSSNPASHIWTVGNLTVGQGATLKLVGKILASAVSSKITNRVFVTGIKEYEPYKINNTSRVAAATIAVVSRFEAIPVDGQVGLEWETCSEVGTAGFYVYRWTESGYVRVNEDLVPAVVGAPQGGVYRLLDPGATPGTGLKYLLEEVEMKGATYSYGPYPVSIPKPSGQATKQAAASGADWVSASGTARVDPLRSGRLARLDANAANAKRTVKGMVSKSAVVAKAASGALEDIRILTAREGIHRVRAADLAAVCGVDPALVAATLSSGLVSIATEGVAVPRAVSVGGDDLFFYAAGIDSIYSDRRAYRLSWAPGVELGATGSNAPAFTANPSVVSSSVHVEQEVFTATALATTPEDDYWFWTYVMAGHATQGTKTFTVTVGDLAPEGLARVQFNLWGATQTGQTNEHHVRVTVNGTAVGETRASGLKPFTLVCTFSAGLLRAGNNTIVITGIKDAGIAYSTVYIDSYDFAYPRYARSLGAPLGVAGVTGAVVTVTGFTGLTVRVWDVTDPRQPVAVTNATTGVDLEGTQGVSFESEPVPHRYVAFDAERVNGPDSMRLWDETFLRDPTTCARYLVITAPALVSEAQRLVDYRGAMGLTGRVVTVDQIYDAFSHGQPDPKAIQTGLRYAATNWTQPPEFVLLAGEGTYDYKNRKSVGDSVVPPWMILTPHGLFVADNLYTDLDADGLPDLAIGRLCVLDAQELRGAVDKIMEYERGPDSAWQTRLRLVSDNTDAGGEFTASNEQLRRHVGATYTVDHISMDQTTSANARTRLLAALNEGTLFVNYYGHGAMDALASERILISTDVAKLTNRAHLPIMMTMSCVLGQFCVPAYDCLGEVLSVCPTGGAIAVWSPSGMSLHEPAEVLADAFFTAVFQKSEYRLGSAILEAIRQYGQLRHTSYLPAVYALLGDPALLVAGISRGQYPYGSGAVNATVWNQVVFRDLESVSPEQVLPDADADGDGIANFVEYAMGLNPRFADGRPQVVLDGTPAMTPLTYDAVMQFVRRKGATDVDYVIQVSGDLVHWYDDNVHIQNVEAWDNVDGVTETVRVTVKSPRLDRQTGYVRLGVRPK